MLALRSPLEFDIEGRRVHGVADDIYITACFARSLAQGAGPVWFPGAEPVEGFSSPVHVLLLGAAHALPFFREDDLGLYTTALGLASLAIAFGLGASIRARLASRAGRGDATSSSPSRSACVLAASLAAAPVAITWWIAEGFEVSLVLVAALAAVRAAVGSMAPLRRGLALGAVAAVASWIRMDAVLYVLPGFAVLAFDRTQLDARQAWRAVLAAVGVLAAALAILFGARIAIFGEWMPNTYYLKLGGSSLVERVLAGVRMGWVAIPVAVLAGGCGAVLLVRRSLGIASVAVGSLLLLLPLGVAYSIHNGGDTWPVHLGADRFASIGLSAAGMAAAIWVLLRPGALSTGRPLVAAVTCLGALCSPVIPTLLEPRRSYLERLYGGEYVRNEQRWFRLGRALERATPPGTKITLGAAGALVYASHRGAIDVHGKCDREIAHMPVLDPRRTPGHQKAYDDYVFATRDPQVAVREPPPSAIDRYVRCVLAGEPVWIVKGAHCVVWTEFDGPCPP